MGLSYGEQLAIDCSRINACEKLLRAEVRKAKGIDKLVAQDNLEAFLKLNKFNTDYGFYSQLELAKSFGF